MTRRALILGLAFGLAGMASAQAAAVELLYVREAGCPWCRAFDRAIGPIYPRSKEARRAPMRDIDRHDPALRTFALAGPIVYTPTFVLTLDNREIGRIEGYPGEDFFWGRLERLLERLPPGS